jgi:hypothetical protein
MSVINGSDLYMWLDDTLIGSATSYEIDLSADALERTNKGTGLYRTYTPGLFEVTASCDGLVVYGGGKDLIYDAMILRLPVKLEFGEQDTGAILNVTKQYYAGYFIITNIKQSAGDAENVTYSATFKHSSGFRKDEAIVYPYLVSYFVDATGGADGNDGLTEATAWQTLTNVHSTTFIPGDAVLFKRGETFRGSIYKDTEVGTAVNRITYGAYGTGARPKILGSKDLSANGDWTNDAGNVWKTTATCGTAQNDISNMVYNSEALYGAKRISKVTCVAQGDFWYENATDLIFMYSVGNPGTFYTHIEACGNYGIGQGIFKWLDSAYITVQNIDFRYSSAAGVEFQRCDNFIVEHNELSWIGGEYLTAGGGDGTRLGNGISLWMGNTNFDIRYNKVNQCFDAGISPQGSGAMTIDSIRMYHNIITNCWYSYELWTDAGQTMTNTSFYNNTCYNSGGSFSSTQRADAYSAHIMLWSINGTMTNIIVKNNIFATSLHHAIRIHEATYPGLIIDNNLYNVADIATTVAGNFATLALWRADCGQEANSVSGDPLFISTTNYHLQAGSPAINEGVNVGLTRDYDNALVSDPPEIGAYEY